MQADVVAQHWISLGKIVVTPAIDGLSEKCTDSRQKQMFLDTWLETYISDPHNVYKINDYYKQHWSRSRPRRLWCSYVISLDLQNIPENTGRRVDQLKTIAVPNPNRPHIPGIQRSFSTVCFRSRSPSNSSRTDFIFSIKCYLLWIVGENICVLYVRPRRDDTTPQKKNKSKTKTQFQFPSVPIQSPQIKEQNENEIEMREKQLSEIFRKWS